MAAQMPMREGFWKSGSSSLLPSPVAIGGDSWPGKQEFLTNLKAVEDHWMQSFQASIDAANKAHEDFYNRYRDVHPSERPPQPTWKDFPQVQAYRGSSSCRICGKSNGSREFHLAGWQWPAGYRHYIEDHNVRPSLAFQEMILGDLIP